MQYETFAEKIKDIKKCKRETYEKHYRTKKINRIIGEEFEFFDPDAMELVTLKVCYGPYRNMFCEEKCYFRKLKNIKEFNKLSDNSHRNHFMQNRIWPCYLYDCSPVLRCWRMEKNGVLKEHGGPGLHYEVVSIQKIG